MIRRPVRRPAWFVAAALVLASILGVTAVVTIGSELSRSPQRKVAIHTATPKPSEAVLGVEPVTAPDATLPPVPLLTKATCDRAAVPDALPAPPSPATTPPGLLRFHVPILMYHRIATAAEAGKSLEGLVVPPAIFGAQMEALDAAGWHTITASALAADLAEKHTPPPKTFVITFDDGYDDGYLNALPILEEHRFVATFFVIAGRIDHPEDLTVDHIHVLVVAGNEIADHTLDHADLTHLTPLQARYEVAAGAERIAQVSGEWPSTFAYPFGRINKAAIAAVVSCRTMAMAVTTAAGAEESWPNRFAVPRVRVAPTTTPQGLVATMEYFANRP